MKKTLSLILSLIMFSCSVGAGFYAFAFDISYGIDVSVHNGDVDYGSVQESGKSFVMIRLGYYNHLDTNFWQNVKAACEAGMSYGVYLYSYADSVSEAETEANFVIDTLSELGDYAEYFKLPVAYDLEDSQIAVHGKTQLTKQMTTFCDMIKDAGYTPMVYCNLNWFTNYIDLDTVVANGYKIWYAYWIDGTPDTTTQIEIGSTGVKPDIWQYKSGSSSSSGYDENMIYYTSELESQYNIKLSKTSITYVGTVQRPTVTVTKANGTALTYKKDFTVSYSNWSSKDVGSYTVTVDFIGDYSSVSSETYTYKITAQTNVTPVLNRTTITMNGTVQRPTVTVTDYFGNKLTYKKDFTVDYSNWSSTAVGRYTVTVKMIGNYSGTKTYPYYINPKSTTISSITALSKGFTVKWNKQTNSTTGYQIQYATKSDFSNAATIYAGASSATSKKITGRAAKTKYYVRIRTYKNIGGKYFYSDWSSAKTVTTK